MNDQVFFNLLTGDILVAATDAVNPDTYIKLTKYDTTVENIDVDLLVSDSRWVISFRKSSYSPSEAVVPLHILPSNYSSSLLTMKMWDEEDIVILTPEQLQQAISHQVALKLQDSPTKIFHTYLNVPVTWYYHS